MVRQLVFQVWETIGVIVPNNPKNRRRRCSILLEINDFVILIDTSPDLREQLLDANVKRVDAVLSHMVTRIIHGLDDLRPMFWRMKNLLMCMGTPKRLAYLRHVLTICSKRLQKATLQSTPIFL